MQQSREISLKSALLPLLVSIARKSRHTNTSKHGAIVVYGELPRIRIGLVIHLSTTRRLMLSSEPPQSPASSLLFFFSFVSYFFFYFFRKFVAFNLHYCLPLALIVHHYPITLKFVKYFGCFKHLIDNTLHKTFTQAHYTQLVPASAAL